MLEATGSAVAPHRVVLADGRRVTTGRRAEPTHRVIVHFIVGTVLALGLVVVAGSVVGSAVAEEEALHDVKALADTVTATVVEPSVDAALLAGDPEALEAFDDLVHDRLLGETPIQRVKLWTASGRIVYSDEPSLIGEDFRLGPDELRVLARGGSDTEVSDLSRDENSFERPLGPRLLEVYTHVDTSTGEHLLFEAYVSYDLIEQRREQILRSFATFAVLGLAVFALFQVFLGYTNLRWLQRQRLRLMERAAQIAEQERRRVARDLHDGVVQNLVGASYVVGGAVPPVRAGGRTDVAVALDDAAKGIRTSIQSLRSMIIDIYPASLRSAGLVAALNDLVAPLRAAGVVVHLDLPDVVGLPGHVEAAVYRVAQEAIRNVAHHAAACVVHVTVRVWHGHVELVVRDDGSGFDPLVPASSGHVGLRTLGDLVEELAGVLEITSAPGRGTTLRAELPT